MLNVLYYIKKGSKKNNLQKSQRGMYIYNYNILRHRCDRDPESVSPRYSVLGSMLESMCDAPARGTVTGAQDLSQTFYIAHSL